MKKSYSFLMTVSFLAFLYLFLFIHGFQKDNSFSALENRRLQEFPIPHMDTIISGKWGNDFETYIADQFPGRNLFVAIKSNSQHWLQRKDNNGVYLGKDGSLLQMLKAPEDALLQQNIDYINQFAQKIKTTLMLVPTATKINESQLPPYATPYDEEKVIQEVYQKINQSVEKVELLSILRKHEKEYLYYKTDHHWTSLGAFYGYQEFCKMQGYPIPQLDDYTRTVVSKEFFGSLFSKGNFTFVQPDSIERFDYKDKQELQVEDFGTKQAYHTLYRPEFLVQKDKYSYFLGENAPLIKIKTDVSNGKKIAVIKDSYANSFVPFLTKNFEEIHVVDLRFYHGSLLDYTQTNKIQEALILFNVNSFCENRNLSSLAR